MNQTVSDNEAQRLSLRAMLQRRNEPGPDVVSDMMADVEASPGVEPTISAWPRVLDLLVDELGQAAGREESQVFLQRVGARMAEELPLAESMTLRALEAAINRRLSEVEWGWCALRDGGRHLIIEHGDHPVMGRSDERARQSLLGLAAILSGLYRRWLSVQGGSAELHLARCHPDQPLLFQYGEP